MCRSRWRPDHDYAHDIRLACYGLDKNDNDFVIGLIGKELHPLSHVVQAMRTTRQTAEFRDKLSNRDGLARAAVKIEDYAARNAG